jgi:hypothetical protein
VPSLIYVLVLYANGVFWTVSAAAPDAATCEKIAYEAEQTFALTKPNTVITHYCRA